MSEDEAGEPLAPEQLSSPNAGRVVIAGDSPRADARQRDAIVYIPGLNRSLFDQSIDTIARKLTGAFERHARADLRFGWIGGHDQEYGDGYRAAVRTITMEELPDGPPHPLIDVYELDYTKTLTGRIEAHGPLVKAAWMLLLVVPVIGPFLGSWRRPGKDWRDVAQLLWIGIVLLAVVVFIVMLVVTAGSMVLEQSIWCDRWQRWLEKSFLVVMISTLFSRWSLKQTVGTLATEYVCAYSYLRMGDRKPAVVGQALALLEYLAEKHEYRHIHVVGYSFGSVVALDLLLPHGLPGARISNIEKLVTIGCPFDLIRSFWPDYFRDRERVPERPRWWINVFSPLDVLGSNFRDDARLDQATSGVTLTGEANATVLPNRNVVYTGGLQVRKPTLSDVVMASGLRAHSMYWLPGSEPETNCFDVVVTELYKGEESDDGIFAVTKTMTDCSGSEPAP